MNKCKISNRCGGCQFLHLEYQQTLDIKKNKVLDLFKQAKLNANLEEVIGAKHYFGYRNKMQLAFKMEKNEVVCGFYEENSHKVINLDTCLIHSDLQNEIASFIRETVIKLKLRPYDEDRRLGLIRHVLIKEAVKTKQIMVVIVTATEIFPARSEFVKMLRSKFPSITTIIQNINPRKTSIVLGEKERVLFGKGYIEDYILDFKFKITSKSFFQVNPEQTEKLYGKAFEYAELSGKETVIDAYSGVGTIGMILSKKAKHVISVENNKQAVETAISNAKDNNIKNVRFYCADATEFLVELAKEKTPIDVLIMDPPRTGSTPAFLNATMQLLPKKLVYVSCEPETLVRDLQLLQKKYQIKKTSLVDMFCWSSHVETVCLLTKK
jgi:23S rRNA (uracil1939-C5)-methyltransferase